MTYDTMTIIINLLITGYGGYCLYGAFQMKYTGFPPSAMVSKNAIEKIQDLTGFCKAIYKPFVVFSIILVITGAVSLMNIFLTNNTYVDTACIIIMVVDLIIYVFFQVRIQKRFQTLI